MGGRITMKKTDYRVERGSIGVKDIPEEVAKKAMKPLTRMLELAK